MYIIYIYNEQKGVKTYFVVRKKDKTKHNFQFQCFFRI